MIEDRETSSRRALLLGAAGALAMAVPASAEPRRVALKDLGKEADVACLYHCDFGDPDRFGQMLTNISNHYSAYGADPFAVEIAIVAHGQGIKFFLASLEGTNWAREASVAPLFERVEALSKSGLRVHLCEITFERMKLDRAKARTASFLGFVPSGVAAVGTLQAKGYGYIKVG